MDLFTWLDSVQQSLQLVRLFDGRWVARIYDFRLRTEDRGYGRGQTPEAAINDFLVRSSGEELYSEKSDVSITMPLETYLPAGWSR